MPTTRTPGNFMTKNVFDILKDDTTRHDTTTRPGSDTTTKTGRPSIFAGVRESSLTASAVKAPAPVTAKSAHGTTTRPACSTTKTANTAATTTTAAAQAFDLKSTLAAVSLAFGHKPTQRQTIADLKRANLERKVEPWNGSLVAAVREAEEIIGGVHSIEYETDDQPLCTVAPGIVKVKVAMDSAASDNVINPEELPSDAEFEPNTTNTHFKGANDSHIERYGSCKTIMSSHRGRVGCNWQMAEVSRALHSVGIVAGPKGGPSMAKQDILFNNDKCYVAALGVVRKLMETLTAVAEYDREGNLYVGEMTLESFRRQGAHQ